MHALVPGGHLPMVFSHATCEPACLQGVPVIHVEYGSSAALDYLHDYCLTAIQVG